MNNQDRIFQFFSSLDAEIAASRAGSSRGQFPILDLLGNLRDEAADKPGLAELHSLSSGAWERMVQVVESGKPFADEDIHWLNDLTARIRTLAGSADCSTVRPRPESVPPALPSAAFPEPEAGRAGPDEEPPLNISIAEDADLLREFITESREHLDHIEQCVLVLEN